MNDPPCGCHFFLRKKWDLPKFPPFRVPRVPVERTVNCLFPSSSEDSEGVIYQAKMELERLQEIERRGKSDSLLFSRGGSLVPRY